MKLNLRTGVAVACATSFAAALIQISACATGELQESHDAGSDVVYRPRPTTSDGGDSSAPTCSASPCVLDVASGGPHTCAVIQGGTVRCWGSNYAGELGASPDGGTPDGGAISTQSQTPLEVAGATGVVGVVGGGPFGSGSYDSDVTCALTATAAPQCWGSNQYDMLGRGTAPDTTPHPELAPVATLTGSSFVSLGQTGACAVTSGALSCWGQNAYQQLGVLDGGFGSSTPVPIALPAGKKAVQAALGYGHVCVILDDQTVACWGYDYYGQCGVMPPSGESEPTPTVVAGVSSVTQLALGSYHSCALTSAGAVECWGYNYEGALGGGGAWDGGYETPTPVTVLLPTGRTATQIAAGEYTTCALLDDGTVACWGFNTSGQVGFIPDGALAVVATPTVIDGVTDAVQIAMGAGGEHVCARLKTGGLKCWGSNASGQLGAATTDAGAGLTESAIPLDVAF